MNNRENEINVPLWDCPMTLYPHIFSFKILILCSVLPVNMHTRRAVANSIFEHDFCDSFDNFMRIYSKLQSFLIEWLISCSLLSVSENIYYFHWAMKSQQKKPKF